jgi:anti-sigma B factor antagonist
MSDVDDSEPTTPAAPPDSTVDDDAANNFGVWSRRESGRTRVVLTGELDTFTAPQLREHLFGLIENNCTDIVVDMAALTFIDSTGLNALVDALKRVRERNGNVAVCAVPPSALKALELTGLTRVLDIED